MIQHRCPSGVRGRTLYFSTLTFAILLVGAFNSAAMPPYRIQRSAETITQNFDTLPNSPTNTSLGSSPLGWIDDTVAPDVGNFSLPGWYLYHSLPCRGRRRQYHRASGPVPATVPPAPFTVSARTARPIASRCPSFGTLGDSLYGLRLTNNTGITLNDFTLGFTAEQWRDGGAGFAQSVTFDYKVTSGAATIHDVGFGPNISQLGFTTPIVGGCRRGQRERCRPGHRITLHGVRRQLGSRTRSLAPVDGY